MRLNPLLAALACLWTTVLGASGPTTPLPNIRGVNLGNWLVYEAWMSPIEWASMGGQVCSDCTQCISTEFDLVKSLGQQKANQVFQKHWKTWFNQTDVDTLKSLGLNTVRIPIGYWIIESLVQKNEYWPQGGLAYLIKGVEMLRQAGIWVQLDLHAMPGISAVYSQFAGDCVSKAEFYTPANYARGLQASAVLTALIHAHPSFAMTFSLQSINEPLYDAHQTPGLGQYYKDFVTTVRATEQWLGMRCPTTDKTAKLASKLPSATKKLIENVMKQQGLSPKYFSKVNSVSIANPKAGYSSCVLTAFMSATWQWNDPSANTPSRAAQGRSLYDEHPYLSFGGVTNPDPKSYLAYFCNYPRYASGQQYGQAPTSTYAGEWWLAAQFSGDANFYRNFGDVQKMAYSQGAGWIYWNFKIEANNTVFTGNSQTEGIIRDYVQSVNAGYLTRDPNAYFNSTICQGYATSASMNKHLRARDPLLKDAWDDFD